MRHPDEFDSEQIKNDLKHIRAQTIERLDKLKTKFKRNLQNISTTRGQKLSCHFANDSVDAVEYIKKVCGRDINLSINKSSTVQELLIELERYNFKITDTYTDELKLEGIDKFGPSNYWETPKLDESAIWDSLSSVKKVKLDIDPPPRSNVKDGNVGLLGVNAISVDSGSIYLVQHLHNIAKIIEACDRLIFVVGLEKLLGSDSDAEFQAKCCGLFGLDNILEELFTRKVEPEAKPPAKTRFKVKKTELQEEPSGFNLPSELHIIILDNGRSDLIGSKFQSLLECIGCKSCSRMCPRVRQGPSSDLEVPTNPRDILLSGFTRGLEFAAEHGLFECTTCGNCENLCPVDIPLPDLTLQMRELCTKEGLVPASHKRISENIEARGNPYLSV